VPSGAAIVRMEIWVDGVKKYSSFGSTTLKTSFTLAPGWHTFSYFLVDDAGTTWNDQYNVTVQ
jgi:hypothetical protein